MQKGNIPIDRVPIGEEKNNVICLVIMSTTGVMAIRMLKTVPLL